MKDRTVVLPARSSLVEHQASKLTQGYMAEKPYYCDLCGKMVAPSSHLKMCFKLSASNTERSIPGFCDKKFQTHSDWTHLSTHVKVHKGRKKGAAMTALA